MWRLRFLSTTTVTRKYLSTYLTRVLDLLLKKNQIETEITSKTWLQSNYNDFDTHPARVRWEENISWFTKMEESMYRRMSTYNWLVDLMEHQIAQYGAEFSIDIRLAGGHTAWQQGFVKRHDDLSTEMWNRMVYDFHFSRRKGSDTETDNVCKQRTLHWPDAMSPLGRVVCGLLVINVLLTEYNHVYKRLLWRDLR